MNESKPGTHQAKPAEAGAPPPPLAADEGREALAFLGRRYSVGARYLGPPAPSAADLRAAAELALRAPDHRQLRPFRFVHVRDAQRERLAALFAADAERRGHGAEEIERARERAHNGQALVAVVAHVRADVEEVPEHEQWMSVGGGVMNFLNALHLLGYGAKVVSGASVRDPDIHAAFCGAGEQLVAWVVAGTPSRRAQPKPGPEAPRVLTDWDSD